MADTTPDPLAAFDAKIERRKKEYWEQLIAAGDPDAVANHDAFCAVADTVSRRVHSLAAHSDEVFELTRQMLMNTTIAYKQGDHEEVARLEAEHAQAMEALAIEQ